MATINDVAKLAGVSGATVSHWLNKTRRVNPETAARVEAAIQTLDYRPNAQARSLKTGESRQIGVINISSVDPFFAEVLLGLERAANAQGYSVLLGHSEFDDAQQAANLKSLLEKGVDGLVINSPVVNDTFRDLVARLSVPCVLLQFYDPSLAVDFVHNDDRTAAYEAACYLIGLGHTRLACIAGLTYPEHTAHQRQQGYEQALREHGLPLRAEYFVVSDYSMQQGYDLFRQLWALPERPSALMTYSDLLALGALRAAADLGVSVPGDVSILGFDDIELAGFTVPRLTTVYQEKHLLGQMAFEQIRRRRADPSLPPQRHVVPAHLVVRESCAPPA